MIMGVVFLQIDMIESNDKTYLSVGEVRRIWLLPNLVIHLKSVLWLLKEKVISFSPDSEEWFFIYEILQNRSHCFLLLSDFEIVGLDFQRKLETQT